MKVVLSKDQIDYLFAFCRKHYVRYYDLQIELVDHLANAIEEKMTANPKIGFDRALHEVYTAFGYKGFAGIVEAKTNALCSQYSKVRLHYLKQYFAIPKVFASILFLTLVYFLEQNLPHPTQLFFLYTCIITVFLHEMIVVYKVRKLRKQQTKELLLTNAGYQQFIFTFITLQIGLHFLLDKDGISVSAVAYYVFCSMVLIIFLTNITYYHVSKQVFEKAIIEYPNAFV